MQIYSLADLTASPVPPKSWTLGSNTLGFVVTNYSNIAFNLSSDKQAQIGTLPPYFSMTVPAMPGETISFAPSVFATSAIAQADMFVNLAESSVNVTPNQTPLAQVPGYQLNVTGNVGLSGVGQVAIQGTPTVAFATGQTVNIGNVPSVAIQSGNVNAMIQNATLNAAVTNAVLATGPIYESILTTVPVTNLAANAEIEVNLGIPQRILVDMIYMGLASQTFGGINPSTKYSCTAIGLYDTIFGGSLSYWSLNNTLFLQSDAGVSIWQGAIGTHLGLGNTFRVHLKNISGATIVSDTLTIKFFAQYASQNVNNPSTSPVNVNQTSQTMHYFGNNTGVSSASFTLLASGGLLYKMFVKVINLDTVTHPSYIFVNSGLIDETYLAAGASQAFMYDFGYGIPNNGATITLAANSTFSGYGVASQ